jgi:cytidylate kinase
VAKSLTRGVISTGALQRERAEAKGVTTLELNIQAETNSEIDRDLDALLVRKGDEDTALVFDSRMAWHFVPTSLKVHLVVSPEVGAARIAKSRTSATESYKTVREAQRAIEDRATSERQRFLARYGVDIARLRNYDVVIDTSDATPEEVVAKILEEVVAPSREQSLWVSPKRIIPTGNSVRLIGDSHRVGDPRKPHLLVCYSRPHFFVVRDYGGLSAALDQGLTLVGASLEAEAGCRA